MILDIKDLQFSYTPGTEILKNIYLSMAEGETVGLIGANGAGKSTLLRLLVGLEEGFSGEISVCSLGLGPKNLAAIRKKAGFVFQDADSQLFMNTVEEDVAFGPINYGFSKKDVTQKTAEALEKVGISHLAKRPIYMLSGGEKKLASIATILTLEPEIILLDEPSIALDPRNRRRLIGILNELPCGKLIASHDLDMIMDTCERTVLLSRGQIAFDGPTEEIMRNKQLLEECNLELPLRFQH